MSQPLKVYPEHQQEHNYNITQKAGGIPSTVLIFAQLEGAEATIELVRNDAEFANEPHEFWERLYNALLYYLNHVQKSS